MNTSENTSLSNKYTPSQTFINIFKELSVTCVHIQSIMIKRHSIFIAATIILLINLLQTGCTKHETVPANLKSIDSTWHKIENALETDSLGYKAKRTHFGKETILFELG